MVIVARHVTVESEQRESYLAGCLSVVAQARGTPTSALSDVTHWSVGAGVLHRWEFRPTPTISERSAIQSALGPLPGKLFCAVGARGRTSAEWAIWLAMI
jgi:hypothetical protein